MEYLTSAKRNEVIETEIQNLAKGLEEKRL
jgi:hypothetical protein